jgi:hypothetical protein
MTVDPDPETHTLTWKPSGSGSSSDYPFDGARSLTWRVREA